MVRVKENADRNHEAWLPERRSGMGHAEAGPPYPTARMVEVMLGLLLEIVMD